MRWQYETDACFRSKAAPCGRGQFESPASPKNDASGPEQVSGAIIAAPPSIKQKRPSRGVFIFGYQVVVLRLALSSLLENELMVFTLKAHFSNNCCGIVPASLES